MKINVKNTAEGLNVALEGRLDTVTAPELEAIVNESVNASTALTVDCTALEYVSSAGLRVLLTAQKKTKGNMKLTGVCEIVMEVFEMTGFADILTIE